MRLCCTNLLTRSFIQHIHCLLCTKLDVHVLGLEESSLDICNSLKNHSCVFASQTIHEANMMVLDPR